MLAARRSSKVSVKDEQQPVARVVFQAMHIAFQIEQFKGNSRFSGQVWHGNFSLGPLGASVGADHAARQSISGVKSR